LRVHTTNDNAGLAPCIRTNPRRTAAV
jgi:hypothetical protein